MARWKFHIESVDVGGKAVCGAHPTDHLLVTAATFSRISSIARTDDHLCAKCVAAFQSWQCSSSTVEHGTQKV